MFKVGATVRRLSKYRRYSHWKYFCRRNNVPLDCLFKVMEVSEYSFLIQDRWFSFGQFEQVEHKHLDLVKKLCESKRKKSS